MGSPVSLVVANLVMEDVEKRALEIFAELTRLWKTYLDNTFDHEESKVVRVFHLSQHNWIESFIQFTMEREKHECLPFFDFLIKRSSNRHLLSAVYRKPTHSDRCLNLRSEYPLQHKQSVLNTLFKRNEKFPPQPEQRNEVCETDSHVELLPQMDDSKQEETTQRILGVYI